MRYHLFGESHGPAVGVVIEGVPAGLALNMHDVEEEMRRRAPGLSELTTARRESDKVTIVGGVYHGITCGTPLCAMIANTDARPAEYADTQCLPRPGHADYTGYIRCRGFNDPRGGGHFSGRLTAPLVFAGAVAKQLLREKGVEVYAHIRRLAGIDDAAIDLARPDWDALCAAAKKPFPVIDDARGERMAEAIRSARQDGDSVGGLIECFVRGMPAGIGNPGLDGTVEGIWARHLLAIPGIKGVEFGLGFALAECRGSEANDAFYHDGSAVRTRTNNNGGINGGITNGMPLVCTAAVKPTPSIAKPQQTVDMRTGQSAELRMCGRHDPCIAVRAVPVVEASTAIAMHTLIFDGENADFVSRPPVAGM